MKNCVITATVWHISTKLTICDANRVKSFSFKIPRWRTAAFLKMDKLQYLTMMQNGSRERIGCPPSWIFKIEFLMVSAVKRNILRHHANFCADHTVSEISQVVTFVCVCAWVSLCLCLLWQWLTVCLSQSHWWYVGWWWCVYVHRERRSRLVRQQTHCRAVVWSDAHTHEPV